MSDRNIVIAGYAETAIVRRSGRTAYDLGGEAFASLLHQTGLTPDLIDGACVSSSISEADNCFLANYMCEALGIAPTWLNTSSLGGASVVAGVARAASAIRDRQCSVAVVLSADAPTSRVRQVYGGYRPEFQAPTGAAGPPAAFGMLMNRYAHEFGLKAEALGALAVAQRRGALLNENACEVLRHPLSLQDYLESRMVADPLRLLDCVMYCDGANAILVTSEDRARTLGLHRTVGIAGYAERTNHQRSSSMTDVCSTGFAPVAASLYAATGMRPSQIQSVQAYDDFTIAVMMQLEDFGICARGEGSQFLLDTPIGYDGVLPINTGGGQLSAGQPGLASGGIMVVEAVRQLMGEAGARQIPGVRNALVTGLGVIPYAGNWSTSAAMILES